MDSSGLEWEIDKTNAYTFIIIIISEPRAGDLGFLIVSLNFLFPCLYICKGIVKVLLNAHTSTAWSKLCIFIFVYF